MGEWHRTVLVRVVSRGSGFPSSNQFLHTFLHDTKLLNWQSQGMFRFLLGASILYFLTATPPES